MISPGAIVVVTGGGPRVTDGEPEVLGNEVEDWICNERGEWIGTGFWVFGLGNDFGAVAANGVGEMIGSSLLEN